MTEFLKNLQNKPEPIKKTIMWTGVFFIMLAIFVFWLFTFPSQIPKTEDKGLPDIWQTLKSQVNILQNLWQK